jgi:hypothetical protein
MALIAVDEAGADGLRGAIDAVYGELLTSARPVRPASQVCGRHPAAMPCPGLKLMVDATVDSLRETHGTVVIELTATLAMAVARLGELQQISAAQVVEELAALAEGSVSA